MKLTSLRRIRGARVKVEDDEGVHVNTYPNEEDGLSSEDRKRKTMNGNAKLTLYGGPVLFRGKKDTDIVFKFKYWLCKAPK